MRLPKTNPVERMSEPVSNEQLVLLFHRAAKWMFRGHRHHDPADGHSHHAQGRILAILGERESISQRELLEMLHIRSASLSELLIKLEKRGLIARQRDEKDKRGFLLRLIESGRAAMTRHRLHRLESAARLFSVLTETERETLHALLSRLVAAWEAGENMRKNAKDDARPPRRGQHDPEQGQSRTEESSP